MCLADYRTQGERKGAAGFNPSYAGCVWLIITAYVYLYALILFQSFLCWMCLADFYRINRWRRNTKFQSFLCWMCLADWFGTTVDGTERTFQSFLCWMCLADLLNVGLHSVTDLFQSFLCWMCLADKASFF